MDSYPQLRPHMHWYPQDADAFPPQMGFDPTKFPMVQGPWPYSTPAYPMPCNGCGYQMNFPGYYHQSPPPHPSFYPPQPCYSWGSHPGFFEPRPACHGQTMPASYMMDHPAFEGKGASQLHHCCGCPNHVCNPKGRSGVKIEEHDPDLEKNARCSSDGGSSLIPSNFKNYPYPIMWIPPHFMRNKEQSQQGRPSRTDLDDAHDEAKLKPAGRSLLEKPKFNEWFPLDMHKRNPFISPQDLAREPSGQKEDEGRNFQFPIIWVPSWDKQNEEGKEKTDPSAGATDSSKNAQLQSMDPDDASAHLPEKYSPVNKNVASAAESNREKEATKEKNAQSSGRKLSLSPTKSSQLPPVCLRVDPLPKKKKNSNDNSRSINSKEAERKGKHSSDNQVHPNTRHRGERDVLARDMDERKEDKHYEKKVKVIEVTSGDPSETKDHGMGDAADLNKFHENEKEKSTAQQSDGNLTENRLKTNAAGDLNFENRMEEKITKRAFSDSEAATLIQAAYRGYEVRRWHMLQKLKQMAAVREGLIKIRGSVEELKSSNDSLCDTSSFERQKVVIGESIMSLLLKLDTIQGVHPSLRDVRKSLARELVGLQEEIDSLTCKSSNAPKEEDGEGGAVQSACEVNRPVANSIVEVDDMGPSSRTEPPRLTQEEKHEEPNELQQGQLQNSKDNSAAGTSPEHLNSGETCSVTKQHDDLEGHSVQGKEGTNGISCQQVIDSVVESREDMKTHSSESADDSQLDKMGDASIGVPSSGAAVAQQQEEAVMLAEEIEIPWTTNPVDHSEAIGQGNAVEPDGSINDGENNVEKEEDDCRTLDAVVEPEAEVGFCDQTTLGPHVDVEEASLEEYVHEQAETHGVDGEADSSPATAASVAPPSAVPGDIVAENQQNEDDTDSVKDAGHSVASLLVADDKVPENHPLCGETFSSLCGEDVKASITPEKQYISGTVESGEDDDIHPGHQPEEEADLGQGEIRMKTSADDASQVEVVGGMERSIQEGEEMVKDSEDGEVTVGSEEQAQAPAPADTRAVEVAGEVNGSSEKGTGENENERLRVMMERLMEVGKEQMDAIAELTGRVRDLEGKLVRSKRSRGRRRFLGLKTPKSC